MEVVAAAVELTRVALELIEGNFRSYLVKFKLTRMWKRRLCGIFIYLLVSQWRKNWRVYHGTARYVILLWPALASVKSIETSVKLRRESSRNHLASCKTSLG